MVFTKVVTITFPHWQLPFYRSTCPWRRAWAHGMMAEPQQNNQAWGLWWLVWVLTLIRIINWHFQQAAVILLYSKLCHVGHMPHSARVSHGLDFGFRSLGTKLDAYSSCSDTPSELVHPSQTQKRFEESNWSVSSLNHNKTCVQQGDWRCMSSPTHVLCLVGNTPWESKLRPEVSFKNKELEQWSQMAVAVFLEPVVVPASPFLPKGIAVEQHSSSCWLGRVAACWSALTPPSSCFKDQLFPCSSFIVFISAGTDCLLVIILGLLIWFHWLHFSVAAFQGFSERCLISPPHSMLSGPWWWLAAFLSFSASWPDFSFLPGLWPSRHCFRGKTLLVVCWQLVHF